MGNLDELTHKGAADTQRRVFYTLTGSQHLQPSDQSLSGVWNTSRRNAKLLGLLVAKLEAEGRISEVELDEMLAAVAL